MPLKRHACLILGLILVSLARGQAPPDKKAEKPAPKPPAAPAIDPEAQRLIDQLADTDFHKRDEAAHRLEAMGARALPALRAASKHRDPEVRLQAAALLGPIETATLLAPKRVTLTLEKKTADEVLDALRKATDYKIDAFAKPGAKPATEQPRYSFRWNDVPFWQALDELCRSAGYTLQQSFGDGGLRLQAGDRAAPFVRQAGAFCITAGGFQQTKTVDFSASPRDHLEAARWDELFFAFMVHAEPRLPLLSVGEPHLTAAYDNENNSMVPTAAAAKDQPNPQLFGYRPGRYYGGTRALSLNGQVNLVRPSPKSSSVKLLKAKVPVTVLVEQKPEVVTDALATAKGKQFKVGTTSITVEEVSEAPSKQMQVRLSLTEENTGSGNPNDFTWMNSLWTRLEVYDDKGNRMGNNGSSWGGAGPNHANITLYYPGGSKPSKLVYHVWTTLNTNIEFEFKDLPLP